MERGGSIYILTNRNKTTLYIGVTSNLMGRLYEHQNNVYPKSFTARYSLYYLIYYENFFSINEAILREKELKGWSRKKKETLIYSLNPTWEDLSEEVRNW
ncbi:MAG: GIY-YIG nuclease family protein [Pelobium sp.]